MTERQPRRSCCSGPATVVAGWGRRPGPGSARTSARRLPGQSDGAGRG